MINHNIRTTDKSLSKTTTPWQRHFLIAAAPSRKTVQERLKDHNREPTVFTWPQTSPHINGTTSPLPTGLSTANVPLKPQDIPGGMRPVIASLDALKGTNTVLGWWYYSSLSVYHYCYHTHDPVLLCFQYFIIYTVFFEKHLKNPLNSIYLPYIQLKMEFCYQFTSV